MQSTDDHVSAQTEAASGEEAHTFAGDRARVPLFCGATNFEELTGAPISSLVTLDILPRRPPVPK
jgi:hypothetical protein